MEGGLHLLGGEASAAQVLRQLAGDEGQVLLGKVERVRQLLEEVLRRWVAAIALEVVEVLRRDGVAILLEDASGELALRKARAPPGGGEDLAECLAHTVLERSIRASADARTFFGCAVARLRGRPRSMAMDWS